MSADEDDPTTGDAPGSVFGNLPDARPGPRSPRRDRASGAARDRAPGPSPPPRAAPEPPAPAPAARRDPPSPPPPPAAEEPAREDEAREVGGLEDLAWAGIAAAAEAATLGVRLATRAMEAVRDSVERR